MNDMWKKGVLLAAIGYATGMLIGVIICLANTPDGSIQFPYILFCGIPGAVAMGSTVIYDVEKWSIARATVTHFLITFVFYYAMSLSLGWFRFGDTLFWIITAAMLAGYIFIWLVMYFSYRRQIRKMNEDLRKMKSSPEED